MTYVINNNCNVIIVDIVGILADLYKYCHIAYIGGGFTRGVHSVIEPAIYGCLIGYGPNYKMLDEAVYMKENNLSISIKNNNNLDEFINLVSDKDAHSKSKKLLDQFVNTYAGSTNKIIKGLNL